MRRVVGHNGFEADGQPSPRPRLERQPRRNRDGALYQMALATFALSNMPTRLGGTLPGRKAVADFRGFPPWCQPRREKRFHPEVIARRHLQIYREVLSSLS